jgi:hypothetical protein
MIQDGDRLFLAGHALAGIMAQNTVTESGLPVRVVEDNMTDREAAAEFAVRMADAVMARLKETQQ